MAIAGPGYVGRYVKGDLIEWKFTILVADVPSTLGTPAIRVYEEGNATEFIGASDVFTVDYDGKTGLCRVQLDTSDSGYNAGKAYDVFISSGAVGLTSFVGACVGHFALLPEPADLRAVNGGSTGATAGKMELKQLKLAGVGVTDADVPLVITADNDAIRVTPGGNKVALNVTLGNGGVGLQMYGGTSSYGADIEVGANVAFLSTNNDSSAAAVTITNFTTGASLDVIPPGGDVLKITPSGTGKAIDALGQIYVKAPIGAFDAAVWLDSTAADGAGLKLTGGVGLDIHGDGDNGADAVVLTGNRRSIDAIGRVTIEGVGTDDSTIELYPTGTGKAIDAQGQVLIAPTNTNDDAIKLVPNGTGQSINAPVEGLIGIIESLRLANAVLGGKITGGGTTTETFRDVNDTKDRVIATVDAFGDRSAITLDLA